MPLTITFLDPDETAQNPTLGNQVCVQIAVATTVGSPPGTPPNPPPPPTLTVTVLVLAPDGTLAVDLDPQSNQLPLPQSLTFIDARLANLIQNTEYGIVVAAKLEISNAPTVTGARVLHVPKA